MRPQNSWRPYAPAEWPVCTPAESLDSRRLCRLLSSAPAQDFLRSPSIRKIPAVHPRMGPHREKVAVMQPAIQQVIRALAEDGRAGAIGIAEHAVDSYLAGAPSDGDRVLSRDILVRDLASLRGIAPHLAGFIGRVETYVASLTHSSLSRAA
ncbi:hypothetical protein [Methylobacterium longum]|uniref:Uncharacterized protein n=2 Tax=Methylobacterium TaxID=407 RepID=A0ABT8APN8_9HYPH|nr:hypothetical protein [Methylobacterium longum]MDN3571867.1 hypothetical protein [Methylobacterium longum]